MSSAADPLDKAFGRLERKMPPAFGRFALWVRRPNARLIRLPLGLLLIAGGFIGFLPILGFWMVPLGLIVLAQDIPPLRRPLARGLTWAMDKWEQRKKRR